jgi:hypothetical protein
MSETYVDKAYSMGYVTGVVDSRYHNCNLLKQVQISQLVDSVKLFLVQNPEKRQYSAASIIEYVIQDKFGCK